MHLRSYTEKRAKINNKYIDDSIRITMEKIKLPFFTNKKTYEQNQISKRI